MSVPLLELGVDRWLTDAAFAARWPGLLAPITWFVDFDGGPEAAPFRYDHLRVALARQGEAHEREFADDFLSFYTWPEHHVTGDRVRCATLPVQDLR